MSEPSVSQNADKPTNPSEQASTSIPAASACACTGRSGFSQWLFSKFTAKMDQANHKTYGARKKALFADLSGDVLEIGPGGGANLRYLPPGVRWIGVEPNLHMHPLLRREADQYGVNVDLRVGVAEQTGVASGTVDAVVGTLVLCSVDNVAAALGEVRRVLRPGGRFLFIEHVAAPRGTTLRRFQELIRPLWCRCADGCHPDRETWVDIDRAGFARVDCEHFKADVPMPLVVPHIAGVAVA